MGFCDDLTLEKAYPEYAIAPGQVFQTKNLYQGTGDFTISADGELIEHRYRYDQDQQNLHSVTRSPVLKRVPIGDRVIEYHGDILHFGSKADERYRELVVRFTHGRLEWICPLDKYPEANHALLIEQGAR